jgi:tight adherence protein B
MTLMTTTLLLAVSIFYIVFFLLDKTAGKTAFLEKRLGEHSLGKRRTRLDIEKMNQYSDIRALDGVLKRQAFISNIDRMLKASGWGISASVFVLGSLIGAFLLYIFLIQSNIPNLLAVPLAALALCLIPGGVLTYRYARYVDLFTQRFPMALQIIRGAVGIGFGISQAFERVANDALYPVNKEFQIMLNEMRLGESLTNSLAGLRKRVPSQDVRTFVVAISVQQESGGNLSELMSQLESTINARVIMRKELKASTAQARLSGWIIIAMPFAVAFLLNFLNPEYLKPLFEDEIGRKIAVGAIILMTIGSLIVKKLVSLRIPF